MVELVKEYQTPRAGRTKQDATMQTLPIGTKVFNRGDMANAEHWGVITAIHPRTKYGPSEYEITPDDDADRQPYTMPLCGVHAVDKGHCGTRIVTKDAYEKLRAEQMVELRRSFVQAKERAQGGDA